MAKINVKDFILPPMSKEALNNLPFGAYIINPDGFIEFFNDKMVEVSGAKDANKIEGQNVFQIPTYKEYGLLEYIEKGLKGESFMIEEIKYVSYVGKRESYRSYYGIPIKNKKDEVVKLLCIVEDITEKKKNQEQIKSDLVEKEILLREVQHRVKNNMQVIYSLLNLQSRNIKDDDARNLIDESKNQIKSMLLVHESLYKSADLAKINLVEFITNLVNNLFQLYQVDPNIIRKSIEIEAADLSIEQAIPCALIINELVTNSLKYAFPDSKEGEIKIELRSSDKLVYVLIVSDNGVGIKKAKKREGSLGLTLVNTLAKQIYGNVEVVNDNGIKNIIKFSKSN